MNTKKALIIISMVILVTLLGTVGYSFIEGWSLFDSLYMTVITITTTGYQEVHPLTHTGRIFTIVLLILGMGIVVYSIGAIMTYVTSIDFNKRRRERMQKKIEQFEGHTIVCGYGRMGHVIVEELKRNHNTSVVIESNNEKCQQLQEQGDYFLEGDAANDNTLISAGVKNARVLVSMIDNDSDGLYIALAARSLNPNIYIIVRANSEKARQRILRAGADKVILPIIVSGKKVAESVLNPAVEDFLDLTGLGPIQEDRIQLADLIITKDSKIIHKRLDEVGPQMRDLIIVGVRKPNNVFQFYPQGDYTFEIDDCLIAMGRPEAYEGALEKFNLSSKTPHRR